MTPLECAAEFAAEFAGRRATVMGLGLFGGGVGVARFLIERGAAVTITDLRSSAELAESLAALSGLEFRTVLDGHDERDFTNTDLVVANPAVPPDAELLTHARRSGVRVTSEIGLFLERSPASWIGVTGTQGKSSTTTFAARLAAAVTGARVILGGNIGGSLLEHLGPPAPLCTDDVCVLELSSYQLEALAREALRARRPAAALAITNVSADHLDRHGSVEAYLDVKRSIASLGDVQTPILVPGDDPRLAEYDFGGRPRLRVAVRPEAASTAGCELRIENGEFRMRDQFLGRVSDLGVAASFQHRNVLMALGLVCAAGIAHPDDARLARAIHTLRAPDHRMQDLGERCGHRIWDNAVATTPESTLSAVRSLEGACICVLGGKDKGLDWTPLATELQKRGARAVTFGLHGRTIAERLTALGVRCSVTADVPAAIHAAWRELAAGESLLFSPGCASFDAYRNFAERAAVFRQALADLPGDPLPEASS